MPRSRLARPMWAAAVFVVHVMVVLSLARIVMRPQNTEPSRIEVRLIAMTPVVPRTVAEPPTAAPLSEAGSTSNVPRHRVQPPRSPSSPASNEPTAHAAATITPQPPTPAASAAQDDSLLDADATRRAIRLSARRGGLATQADDQIAAPALTRAQRLPGAIEQAGKGDCLKGEYAGAGMGLISVPFLAAAIATGKCAK